MVARITEMSITRKLVAEAAIAAMMVSAATPAMARGNVYGGFGYGNSWGGGGWGGGRHHRDHDRVDAGDVIGAIAVVGIIAAIASAASKSKKARDYPSADGYPAQRDSSIRNGSINTENAAVDACTAAAEERGGQTASVRDISNVRSSSDGWDVEGTLEQRSNWRDRTAQKHRFTCSVRYGDVDSLYIDGDAVALR